MNLYKKDFVLSCFRGVLTLLVFAIGATCGRRPIATPPSNDLLIVGYDR